MPLFFQKKHEPNLQAMRDFWHWFQENEQWMIERLNGPESGSVVWAVDAPLKPIFSYFKGEIEFQLGFNKGQGEFFFFDLHNRNLHSDAEQLAALYAKGAAAALETADCALTHLFCEYREAIV